jgi:F-type H+-transporting ATPase subunit epsilon
MTLKVFLPYRVYAEVCNVVRVVVDTIDGSYGFLPHRLDCVVALVPGVFMYQTADGVVSYLAVDDGVMIKTGTEVRVSVRDAVGGASLDELRQVVEKEYRALDELERETRTSMARMELEFIKKLDSLRK